MATASCGPQNSEDPLPTKITTNLVASLVLDPQSVVGGGFPQSSPIHLGQVSYGTVTLAAPAAAGGEVVTLSSSDPFHASAPANMTIPEGASSGRFNIGTTPTSQTLHVTITATSTAGSSSGVLTVTPGPSPSLALSSAAAVPDTIDAGQSTTVTATLNTPAPVGGLTLSVIATFDIWGSPAPPAPYHNSDFFSAPPALTIPEGQLSGSIVLTTTNNADGMHPRVVVASADVYKLALFTVRRILPSGNAVFDPALLTPRCNAVVASCDTGGMIDGRSDHNSGPETNTPNTIHGTCVDGLLGTDPGQGFPWELYHLDGAVNRLKVSTLDGSALAAGKTVKMDVATWSTGRLDLFSAPDANNPVWTYITSITPAGIFSHDISTTFTLPAGSLQAIRANWAKIPTFDPSPCPGPSFRDNFADADDLVFATDNGGPPTNIGPTVAAGPDQMVTLPVSAVSLTGSFTDDGLPAPPATTTASWSMVSGPGTVTIGDSSASSTTATFSAPGTYVLRLTASDGALSAADDVTVIVNPQLNQGPTANAGPDQMITLPATAALAGAAIDDGLPAPPSTVTTSWSVVSGPGTVTFADASALTTIAAFSVQGSYTLRLTASDGFLSGTDDVVVTVNPRPNLPPTANAGPDQMITLPATAALAGAATDDGLPAPPSTVTTTWSVVSGPGTVTFADASGLTTIVAFSVQGSYTLRLTASDGLLSGIDDIVVSVSPRPNLPPTANAGPDQTITLPAAVTLSGVVSDDGLPNPPGIPTATWSKVSGPGTVTFANPGFAATSATFSAAGQYVLRLTASDGASAASDDALITVNPAPVNRAPVANAGPDQTVTLPAAANLSGTVTDDGLPNPPHGVQTNWSRASGPGAVTFANAAALVTTARFSIAGIYVLRLSASDGALVASDSAMITVRPAPVNRAPVVNAGADQTITLHAAANLSGTVTDDGLPNPPHGVQTTWSRVSGPGTVAFGAVSSLRTTAVFSATGTYVLRLTASDGALSGRDDVQVLVRRP